MGFIETLQQLDRLAHLIKREATGTPSQLASRMEVSERTIVNLVHKLRSLGAEIEYCRSRETYYFTQPVEISFNCINTKSSSHEIRGGRNLILDNSPNANFLRLAARNSYCFQNGSNRETPKAEFQTSRQQVYSK